VSSAACNDQQQQTVTNEQQAEPQLKEENVTYSDGDVTLNGYIVYDGSVQGKRPAVLVVHEWWGQTEYPRKRARDLAALGYVAMAVDIYGNGKTADNPTDAQALAGPFYADPALAKRRVDAALATIRQSANVDTSKIAAIGYCFGGGLLINVAKLGANLDGVVSFHGSLVSDVPVKKELLQSKILVCHGSSDPFVPEEEAITFQKQMDSIGADYTFKAYPDAMHAFTNPEATENGKKFNIPIAYNAAADSASWKDMQAFLARVFE